MKYVSIVILTCNQCALTERCLVSLSDFLQDEKAEIILVDNHSTDKTEEMIRDKFPEVKYLRLDKNMGVAAGRNAGLAMAKGDFLMILDNDTVVPRGSIPSLLRFLENHPDVGLVGPRLESPQGHLQESWKGFPGICEKIKNVIRGRSPSKSSLSAPQGVVFPYYVIGAAQMFRREVWDAAGPLDPHIFYGPEDADFCEKVRRAGWKVAYYPEVMIIHDWQRITTRNVFGPMGRRHIKGLLHFYRKWKRIF